MLALYFFSNEIVLFIRLINISLYIANQKVNKVVKKEISFNNINWFLYYLLCNKKNKNFFYNLNIYFLMKIA